LIIIADLLDAAERAHKLNMFTYLYANYFRCLLLFCISYEM